MCLAIPGKVIEIIGRETPTVAKVDFKGVIREVVLPWQEIRSGDYVLVHAGVALSRIDSETAHATWSDLEKITQV